jgi:hypothetical protein
MRRGRVRRPFRVVLRDRHARRRELRVHERLRRRLHGHRPIHSSMPRFEHLRGRFAVLHGVRAGRSPSPEPLHQRSSRCSRAMSRGPCTLVRYERGRGLSKRTEVRRTPGGRKQHSAGLLFLPTLGRRLGDPSEGVHFACRAAICVKYRRPMPAASAARVTLPPFIASICSR